MDSKRQSRRVDRI